MCRKNHVYMTDYPRIIACLSICPNRTSQFELAVSISEKVRANYPERPRDVIQSLDKHTPLTALDLDQKRPVQTRSKSQLLLSQAGRNA